MSRRKCLSILKHMTQPNTMEHLFPILESGLGKEELTQPKLLEDTISTPFLKKTTLLLDQTTVPGVLISSIPEFHLESNEMILNDSLCSSKLNILDTPLSKISDLESTINDQASKPFWNNCSKEISKKLWLPTLTVSPDSGSISFNGCLNNTEQYWSQWIKPKETNERSCLMTSWKFLPSLQPVTMAQESIQRTVVTRKIKIHPSKRQKELFQKCFQSHRFFYNKAIKYINTKYSDRKEGFTKSPTCVHCVNPKVEGSFCCEKHQTKSLPWKLDISLISLRKQVIKSDKEIKGTKDEWQSDVPYDTRQLAIKDAVAAYKACVTNKKRGNIDSFNLRYKSRRNLSQIFWIDSSAIKYENEKLQIFPKRLKKDKYIRIRNRPHDKIKPIEHDCKIMKYGNSYYLVYTFDKENNSESIKKDRYPVISLDPGVRTFQTGYSPSGIAIKIGDRQNEQLKGLHNKLDILRGLRAKAILRRKQNLRKRCLKVEKKILNVIDNLHNQTASFLTSNFETILLPKFRTSVMQTEEGLHSSTKRQLWTLSHYKFQQKLKGLCEQKNNILYLVDEHYTTKTCGGCGSLMNVGSSKIFNCTKCSYKMDRDIHGARNILLKHIT